MAFISLLLSFIGRKIGDIVQAIFGWSVTALFGRLPQKKQLAVTVALVLSIAWPVFVIGLLFPAVAGWAIAILPLESWFGPLPLRIAWAVLAVVAPPIVGLLVHWAAPSPRGSALRSAVAGYPLAAGLLVSFLITAVSVPILKVVSLARGWSDTHVYVQARVGSYQRVVRELAEACARAGVIPEITVPPKTMTLATNALRVLAKAAVSPIVAEELVAIRAEGVELVLYPSDLLLRGKPTTVARVRAMMARTDIDADAYLVGTERAQQLQNELGRLRNVMREHEAAGRDVGAMATRRLVEIWREMTEADLPFEEWVMLESIARRLERRLVSQRMEQSMPLDDVDDGIAKVAAKVNAELGTRGGTETQKEKITMSNIQPTPERLPLEEASTADLVREALDEAKELVRVEVEIAKSEVESEIARAKRAAIGLGVALAAAVLVLCMLAVALVLALGGTAVVALAVAGGLLVIGGVAGAVGYSLLPKKPLERTRHRLKSEVTHLKEHIA
ncbi:MAG TPA: phage holin family protein [Labilithrix sp.]|nr:phage holin family protein [Labilithrix sp.]